MDNCIIYKSIFYIKYLIGFYINKNREKSNIINFIHIFIFFGFCYFVYLDTNNFKAINKGYKEFNGVYVGIKDLNDYPNRRTFEI